MEDDNLNPCAICFEPIANVGDHRLVALKCGHLFGDNCIRKWIKAQKKCPQCNCKAIPSQIRYIYSKNLVVRESEENDKLKRTLAKLEADLTRCKGEKIKLHVDYECLLIEHETLKKDFGKCADELQAMKKKERVAQKLAGGKPSVPAQTLSNLFKTVTVPNVLAPGGENKLLEDTIASKHPKQGQSSGRKSTTLPPQNNRENAVGGKRAMVHLETASPRKKQRVMSDELKARIEENRKRALEKRMLAKPSGSSTVNVEAARIEENQKCPLEKTEVAKTMGPSVEDAKAARIEENRKRALEKRALAKSLGPSAEDAKAARIEENRKRALEKRMLAKPSGSACSNVKAAGIPNVPLDPHAQSVNNPPAMKVENRGLPNNGTNEKKKEGLAKKVIQQRIEENKRRALALLNNKRKKQAKT